MVYSSVSTSWSAVFPPAPSKIMLRPAETAYGEMRRFSLMAVWRATSAYRLCAK